MFSRLFKEKSKAKEDKIIEIQLNLLSQEQSNGNIVQELEKLKEEMSKKEKTLQLFSNHLLISLDANIDDMKLSIDRNQPKQICRQVSFCDMWLRLESIESMTPELLANYLRKNQLYRPELRISEKNMYDNQSHELVVRNPRYSRLTHFHICSVSDEYHPNTGMYIGLLVFSYKNLSKFVLNRHYCRRGDILVKNIKFLDKIQMTYRNMYDNLCKWYWGCSIDEDYFGIGFICDYGRCRFDLITSNSQELFRYEYRMFDMFLLTSWLKRHKETSSVSEMEKVVKDIIMKQYDIVRGKLSNENISDLRKHWNEIFGTGENDLNLAIEQLMGTIKQDLETLFQEIDVDNNSCPYFARMNT